MQQDNQKAFISWLAKKLKVQSNDELKSALQQMGDDGIQEAYKMFQQESGATEAMENGGKFDYIKCLQEFKKGGKMMKGCGCGAKMKKGDKIQLLKENNKVESKQIGGILTGLKGALGFTKGASTIGQIGKIVGGVAQGVKTVKGLTQPQTTVPTYPTTQVGMGIPNVPNATTTTKAAPDYLQRTIPQVKMEEGGELDETKLEKLKTLKNKKNKKK